MRTHVAALLHILLAPVLFAAPPRIAFERFVPAEHDIGSTEEVAIVRVNGSSEQAEWFVDELLRDLDRTQLRARDIRFAAGPAAAHLDVKTLACNTINHEGEGSVRDVDGNKVKKRYFTVEATCTARIDVLNRVMRYQSTFYVTGAGTSPRVDPVTEEDRVRAIEHAVRTAASEAAHRITPRRVRESIELDASAPAFEDGLAMIEAGRLAEARTIWERALRTDARSAPLRYNLGAVCEAMGDRRTAELHYGAARQLAPGDARYANELKMFVRRGKQ
jgi:tetratricopeptide (TPR) repeat protein